MTHIYGIDANGQSFIDRAAGLLPKIKETAIEVDENAAFPAKSIDLLHDQGLMGLCVPTDCGGHGQTPGVFAGVVEQLARGCPSTAMIYVMHVTGAQALAASQTLSSREAILKDIAAGTHLTTLAFSERGSRSQFWAPVSTLQAGEGDGFTTSASKSWVTSANHADSYVSSGLQPNAASPLESVLYLVRRESAGVAVESAFNGLGLRGNDSARVKLENLAIAAGDLVTPLGEGAAMMLEVVLPWFVVGTAAMSHGLCLAAVQATQSHLTNAGFSHTDSKLRDLPNLRARLAEMNCRTEQSRALLGHTVGRMLAPDEQTPLFVLQARLAAIETVLHVTDLAMKACGGAAFSRHLGIEQIFRDARAGWVMAPTADHLQEFVGRALTGLPLF